MFRCLVLCATAAVAALTFWPAAVATVFAEPPASTSITLPSVDATQPIDLPGLHNVVAYTKDLISGGWPEGDLAFDSLGKLGIQTIISVDGSLPDVETAKKHGLRYVHLPIGYNGMDDTRTAEIARAARDLPKPIYIHCHHGKHRSASAAAAAAAMLGWLTQEQALAKMKISGTAENYTGLWDAVHAACTCDPKLVDRANTAFPEKWTPSDFVETMVEIDELTDSMKLIEKSGWAVPADHPDLVPAAVAGQLADHFRLAHDGEYTKAQPQDFKDRIAKDQKLLAQIEEGLLNKIGAEPLGANFKLVLKSCKDCHADYRDKAEVKPRLAPAK